MIILDLDNTIADDSWRIPRINWQLTDPLRRYHDYHSLSPWDNPGNSHLFADREDVIVCTARPVLYRSVTEEWLNRNGVKFEALLMRNNEDHCHSAVLKEKQLGWIIAHYEVCEQDIECAYDDRPDVIDMYRRHGVNAQLISIHNVCAYTRPTIEKEAA